MTASQSEGQRLTGNLYTSLVRYVTARLDDSDRFARIFSESSGNDKACKASANNDVVKRCHVESVFGVIRIQWASRSSVDFRKGLMLLYKCIPWNLEVG